MIRNLQLVAIGITLVAAMPDGGRAQTIDFETIPGGGTPTDNMLISTQYQSTYGVSFSLEGGGFPRIAKVGTPRTAFYGPPNHTGFDNPEVGQNVGDFFLTDDGIVDVPPAPLIIDYDTPVSAASGVIIDIDAGDTTFEGWLIQARNAADAAIDSITITAGNPGTGDGIATPWSFNHSSADIHSIRMVYNGTPHQGVGLAFDNFSPVNGTGPGANYLFVNVRRAHHSYRHEAPKSG